MLTRSVVAAATVAAAACALAVPSVAGPRGPAFGTNRYQTEIRAVGGLPDTDDYTSPLLAGERLTVVVSAKGRDALRPSLRLLRPDGTDAGVEPDARRDGRHVSFRGFEVDESGSWTVRVGGEEATEGAYVVSFKVRSAKPLRLRNQRLGDESPLERSHDFPGIDGGLLDLVVRFRKGDSPVDVRAISDPAGDDVPGPGGLLADAVATRRSKLQLRQAPISTGDGRYAVRLGIDQGEARYTLLARVRPGARPKGRALVRLSAEEPFLGQRAEPVRGIAGREVRFTGGGFSADPHPVVLFDGVPAVVTAVETGGSALRAVPPLLDEGATVEVAVVNPDGQAAVAPEHFHYARPPQVTGLVRPRGGTAIGGDTLGGQEFHVQGLHLHPEQTVLFGDAPATLTVGGAPGGALAVLSPAHAVGLVRITVRDPYGRSSASAFEFEYKPAPRFL